MTVELKGKNWKCEFREVANLSSDRDIQRTKFEMRGVFDRDQDLFIAIKNNLRRYRVDGFISAPHVFRDTTRRIIVESARGGRKGIVELMEI